MWLDPASEVFGLLGGLFRRSFQWRRARYPGREKRSPCARFIQGGPHQVLLWVRWVGYCCYIRLISELYTPYNDIATAGKVTWRRFT